MLPEYKYVPDCWACNVIMETIYRELGDLDASPKSYFTWRGKIVKQVENKMSRKTALKHINELIIPPPLSKKKSYRILKETSQTHILDLLTYVSNASERFNEGLVNPQTEDELQTYVWFTSILEESIVLMKGEVSQPTRRKILRFASFAERYQLGDVDMEHQS
jgi:uncharacterized protein involved in tolerance to divalent cations